MDDFNDVVAYSVGTTEDNQIEITIHDNENSACICLQKEHAEDMVSSINRAIRKLK